MNRDGKLGIEIACLAIVCVPMFAGISCVAVMRDDVVVPAVLIGASFISLLSLIYAIYMKN